jgi:hypothetical protein
LVSYFEVAEGLIIIALGVILYMESLSMKRYKLDPKFTISPRDFAVMGLASIAVGLLVALTYA